MTTPIDGTFEGLVLARLDIPRWMPPPVEPRAEGVASTELHVGSVDDSVTVVHVPDLEALGVCRLVNWSPTPDGPRSYLIALREWDLQVLLHELLHVIVNPVLGEWTYDHRRNPQLHRVINAVEVGLLPHLALLAGNATPEGGEGRG